MQALDGNFRCSLQYTEYAPNADRHNSVHVLSQTLLELGDIPILLVGDLNQILDKDLDRSQPRNSLESKSAAAIRLLARDLVLKDT